MRAFPLPIACLLLAGVTPSPSPSPSATALPSAATTASPSSSPAASASASPSPTPLPTPTVLMLPPDAPPQILWVNVSSTTPRAGDTVLITVLASSNVASVEIRVGGYGQGMTKKDVGHFESSSVVPRLPFFMSHDMTLQIIARNTAGLAVEQDVRVHVR